MPKLKRKAPTDDSVAQDTIPAAPDKAALHTVAHAAARLLPPQWRIECIPGSGDNGLMCGSIAEDGGNSYYSGGGYIVRVPCPDTPECLFIFLHEIGHVVLEHVWVAATSKNAEPLERAASHWAFAYMEAAGIEPPATARVSAPLFASTRALTIRLREAGVLDTMKTVIPEWLTPIT